MKLSKQLTTVTTLSKTLFAILLISLPLVGFLLGMEYQQKITPPIDYEAMREDVLFEFGIGATPHNNYIAYTSNGFEPNVKTFKAVTTYPNSTESGILVWENNSDEVVEIAVDPHPHHNGNRAITNGEFSLILEPNTAQALTITKTGTYTYHNERNLSQTGTVVVE